MESLSVLLRQFFISFFAGCVINAYLIIYYFVLKNTDILPYHILNKISHVSLSSMSSIFIFTVVAMVLGLIIEGVFQISLEEYYFKEDKTKDKNKKKHTPYRRLLNFFVAVPTIRCVCDDLSEKRKNDIKAFIDNDEISDPFDQNFYDTIQMCAKVIEKDGINVYRFRDVSFIMQLMRISFFFVFGASILSSIIFSIILYRTEYFCSFFIFNSLSLIISLAFICIIPIMSRAIGRRHIYEVGLTYNALRHVRLTQKINSSGTIRRMKR